MTAEVQQPTPAVVDEQPETEAPPTEEQIVREHVTTSDRTISVEETVAREVRLDDGSTHTTAAIADAGEACLQQACTAAQHEDQLRRELYVLRAKVDGVLEQVADLVADGHISTSAVAGVRQDLRDALGLDTP